VIAGRVDCGATDWAFAFYQDHFAEMAYQIN
jgi:hypothetical protein